MIDQYLAPLLIGQNPWDTEFLWQHMYRKTMAFGRKGVAIVAISAIDIALWDLMGKAAKQPCYRLMGAGPSRASPSMPADSIRSHSRIWRPRRAATRAKAMAR